MVNNKIALYAGSFDPFHQGHSSIVDKATQLFDKIYIVITWNPDKDNLDRIDQNYAYISKLYQDNPQVYVIANKNKLTAHLAQELGVKWLIRGARNDLDYNYELELACGNKSLNHELETVLILPDCNKVQYQSRLLRHKEKFNV
ncbi:pantetheine-phosphate adenylyltransferase [Mycoplasma sp. Z463D]